MAHLTAAVWAVAWLDGMPKLTVGAGACIWDWPGRSWPYSAWCGRPISTTSWRGSTAWRPRRRSLSDWPGRCCSDHASLPWQPLPCFWRRDPPDFCPGTGRRRGCSWETWGRDSSAISSASSRWRRKTQMHLPALLWLLLLGPFFLDATITLLRRLARREPVHHAHRTHAYQRAVQAGWSHRRVTLTVIGLNLVLGLVALPGGQNPHVAGWNDRRDRRRARPSLRRRRTAAPDALDLKDNPQFEPGPQVALGCEL